MVKLLMITFFLPALLASPPRREGKIIGGSNATGQPWNYYEVHPYQVAILTPTGSLYCGGTIISIWCVLTAASCKMERSNPGFKIVSGTPRIDSYDKENERLVEKFVPHPSFVNAGQGSDVAIIKVDKMFVFNSNVQPIVIRKIDYPDAEATALGWGMTVTGDGNSTANVLQKVTLRILKDSVCTSKWGILPNNVLCASSPGKDTCQGDNGGPLVQYDNREYVQVQVGITSFRVSCADSNLPGIYTNVLSYADSFIFPTARSLNPL